MKIGAIGVVEINYNTNGIIVLDHMLKTADIELISYHKKLGGRMVHIVVSGKVSSVKSAIDSVGEIASVIGENNIKMAVSITNPHAEVLKLMNMLDDK